MGGWALSVFFPWRGLGPPPSIIPRAKPIKRKNTCYLFRKKSRKYRKFSSRLKPNVNYLWKSIQQNCEFVRKFWITFSSENCAKSFFHFVKFYKFSNSRKFIFEKTVQLNTIQRFEKYNRKVRINKAKKKKKIWCIPPQLLSTIWFSTRGVKFIPLGKMLVSVRG